MSPEEAGWTKFASSRWAKTYRMALNRYTYDGEFQLVRRGGWPWSPSYDLFYGGERLETRVTLDRAGHRSMMFFAEQVAQGAYPESHGREVPMIYQRLRRAHAQQ